MLLKLKRGRERSPKSSRLGHVQWWHQPSSLIKKTSFLQARDSPLTSSAFLHVSKELKIRDEFSQVLFSGFCRKVCEKKKKAAFNRILHF